MSSASLSMAQTLLQGKLSDELLKTSESFLCNAQIAIHSRHRACVCLSVYVCVCVCVCVRERERERESVSVHAHKLKRMDEIK